MNYSDFKKALPDSKRKSDPLWARLVLRSLSLPTAWILYRFGLSGNAVSMGCIVLSLIAAVLLGTPHFELALIGALAFNLVALGDCVDGNIARATGKTGPSGEFMDALCGYTVYALLPLALGFRAEALYAFEQLPGVWVLLGGVVAIANLYMRVVYQKYVNMSLQASEAVQDTATPSTKSALVKRISGEVGLVGWMMPLLLITIVLHLEWLFLIFYSLFYLVTAAGMSCNFALKVLRQG